MGVEWSDDLTIPLPAPRTIAELVDFVLRCRLDGIDGEEIDELSGAEFGLSLDDAEFARDRVDGGLVRASSGIPANCPPRDQDPIAWESFQRGTNDPSLIARIFPQFSR